MFNAALLDQFNKYIEQFNSQTKNSWEHLLKIVQASYVDSTQRMIKTGAQAGPAFKTMIGLDEDLNEFPTPPPEANNVYWVRRCLCSYEPFQKARFMTQPFNGIRDSIGFKCHLSIQLMLASLNSII